MARQWVGTCVVLTLALAAPAAAEPVFDPQVTAETAAATVCLKGYTRATRPSSRWLRRIKLWLLATAGLGPEHAPSYQLDHALPLVLGGNPRAVGNMHLEPLAEAKQKDAIERKLGCLVCAGRLDLDEARDLIADDWQAAAQRYGHVRCRRHRAR